MVSKKDFQLSQPSMSELRFRVSPGIVPAALLNKAYFAGWGRTPRPTEIAFEENDMLVRPDVKGSGSLHVLWPHRQLGLVMESTDSLLSRTRPYYLARELGRGALGRLLRKLFEWQILGFRPEPELRAEVHALSQRFSKAVVADPDDSDVEREHAFLLEEFGRVALDLTHSFTEQSLAWRTRANEKLPVLFGIGLNSHPINSLYEFDLYAKFLQDAFHAVLPMPSWRELEPEPDHFCWESLEQRFSVPTRFGFQIVMGPLLCFDASTFPTWLLPRLSEEGYFESRATRFVNAVMERYGSMTGHWILANRFNSHHIKELPIPRALTLVRLLAQQARSRGIETPILVGIDRPWGEYALSVVPDYDQIQIAESLMGCHEIDAFLMELNFGLDDRSTFPRDPMAISTMIDQWSFLGKKVFVALSVPSAPGAETQEINQEISPELLWSEGLQRFWVETLLNTLLAKRMVQGIFWTPLQDSDENPEDTRSLESFASPYAGLIDSSRVLKLAFKQFIAVRKAMLK